MRHQVKVASILLLLISFISAAGAWVPTPEELKIIQRKIDSRILPIKELLPQNYFDFVTREAIACHAISMTVEALDPGYIGLYRGSAFAWKISLSEISSWDAVNVENLVHELTHAGANGSGFDEKGYNRNKEVNARLREAENWRDAAVKPPRDTQDPLALECWANYDIIFSAKGIQRTHDFIKNKMFEYGYNRLDM